ncbi:nuclear export protein [Influenza B virus (B/Georgia/26/2015)]|uniref:Nuclear export protein n=6 Tax=Influenza B virus TaxID=11520 RepID=A0A2P1KN93_9INFB|nr:nuclear export protein [Influenza B virus (B/Managua/4787.01/2008)]AGX22289.1 nuclear export protein [Influenza B virus (B/Brisbane/5/2004)]AKU40709.1 nuclear export protein [Influenza B virus (B/New York/WC-LVD-14-009/2014)]ALH42257.1 nuclear export protein [Influenza B virus (B/Georgia/26/2015)]AUP48599.1 nuclear export protein [Influenza B virus (B/North Dakota/14/2017)]AVP04509.1 nuclear export protein [Influenza B virus]
MADNMTTTQIEWRMKKMAIGSSIHSSSVLMEDIQSQFEQLKLRWESYPNLVKSTDYHQKRETIRLVTEELYLLSKRIDDNILFHKTVIANSSIIADMVVSLSLLETLYEMKDVVEVYSRQCL